MATPSMARLDSSSRRLNDMLDRYAAEDARRQRALRILDPRTRNVLEIAPALRVI